MNSEPFARIVDQAMATRLAALPASVILAAKMDILDIIGVAVAGRDAAGVPEVLELLGELGGNPTCGIIASSLRAPAPAAALANSCMGHALDFDDTHDRATLHAGIALVPAALAAAEHVGGVSGARLLEAVVCGLELVVRMGLATRLGPNITGWHLTSVYGCFGAALAAGMVLGLDRAQLLGALGLAYSQGTGNVQAVKDGALAKRLQPGFAASAGVMSALLARKGLSGAQRIVTGEFGYFKVYQNDDMVPGVLGEDPATSKYHADELSFKMYPCCRFLHTAIDAALRLRERAPDLVNGHATITAINIAVNEEAWRGLVEPVDVKRRPRNSVDAQFSFPYTVATALIKGRVGIVDFSPAALVDEQVLALAQRVHVEHSAALDEDGGKGITPAIVTLRRNDGTVLVERNDTPTGSPPDVSFADIEAKFRACIAGRAGWSARADAIVDCVRELEQRDSTELMALLGV